MTRGLNAMRRWEEKSVAQHEIAMENMAYIRSQGEN